MGERCPYPEFYKRASPAVANQSDPALPMDDRGRCIFHSEDVPWKRKNNFAERFFQLVQLLEADDGIAYYDFVEFVFVGSEATVAEGSQGNSLRVAHAIFRQQTYFNGSTFLDSLELVDVNFQNGVKFDHAQFKCDLRISDSSFRGFEIVGANLAQCAFFTRVEFLSFTFFHEAQFTGKVAGYAVKFEDARFEGITDFSCAVFNVESSVGFERVRFEDFTDFRGAQFNCHVVFSDVTFAATTEFIDTLFDTVVSTARYRGAAVEFNSIDVPVGATLIFTSTDFQNKMFKHDVLMSFRADPGGTVRFKNVNIGRFSQSSKDRLTLLAKSGRIEIGSGCIKYRFQTSTRTVSITQGNAPLILELCQTFVNYFTVSSGLNLGLEIVERDLEKISLFYYTDEDILQEEFIERLSRTEEGLWNLLSVNSDAQLLLGEAPAGMALSTVKESTLINAVDGISALLGTFFRVGVRIAAGAWREVDTRSLLGAIRFNDDGADSRAISLHRVLVDKYTRGNLLSFSGQQNALLPSIDTAEHSFKSPTSPRIKILFLGANSLTSPLELDREVRGIQTNLKLAKERDSLELKQEWAVTVDTLTQAMLDESPTLVHFSGHGKESGIILEDEKGGTKVVSPSALAELFKLFRDQVRCVVLNSCYSEPQARAIRQHIPYVIGMRSSIPDLLSIAFSAGFYKAIGAGKDIPFAFDFGKTFVQLEGFSDEGVLVLL